MGKSIDQILNDLNVSPEADNGLVKVAGASAGTLEDFYNQTYGAGGEEHYADNTEKVAFDKEAEAAYMEHMGEIAGEHFNDMLTAELFKYAMDNSPEAKATGDKSDPAGDGVLLPVNNPTDADQAVPTNDPQYYSLESAALQKARLEKMLEDPASEVDGSSLSQVDHSDEGLAQPTSQATA